MCPRKVTIKWGYCKFEVHEIQFRSELRPTPRRENSQSCLAVRSDEKGPRVKGREGGIVRIGEQEGQTKDE